MTSFGNILFIKTSTLLFHLCDFWNITVSQGSVATHLKYGRMCNVANFVLRLAVKEFRKSVNIWRNYRHERVFW